MTDEAEKERKRREEAEQLRVKNEMEQRLGDAPTGDNPQFSLKQLLNDAFTMPGDVSGTPDWMKIGVAGIGGIAGALLAVDTGILGMLASAAFGTVISGAAGVFLVDHIRGDNKKRMVPPPIDRPFASEANENTLAKSQSVFPEVAPIRADALDVTVPAYEKAENPAPPATRAEIEVWRKIVAKANPDSKHAPNAVNSISRRLLEQLESKQNQYEMNLRYMRDEFPRELEESRRKVDEYFGKFSPEVHEAMGISLDPMLKANDIALDTVPGRYGKLLVYSDTGVNDELEVYGRHIKEQLAQELATLRGVSIDGLAIESPEVMADKAWDELSVIAKRNLITNFTNRAIYDILSNPTDWRHFFPEQHRSLPTLITSLGLDGLASQLREVSIDSKGALMFDSRLYNRPLAAVGITDQTESERFIDAYQKKDLIGMAKALEDRLNKDESELGEGSKLGADARERMQLFVMGLKAQSNKMVLDRYIQDELIGKQLPALEKYENAMIDHAEHIKSVNMRMRAFERGGKKFLVVDEGKLEGKTQTLTVFDARDDKKRSLRVEMTYEQLPAAGTPGKIQSIIIDGIDRTAALPGISLPQGKEDSYIMLQGLLDTPEMLAANTGSPSLRDLAEPERLANSFVVTDAGTHPAGPRFWDIPPAKTELAMPDKKRDFT